MQPCNIIFATNNPHKLEEVQHLLSNTIHLLSLRDMGYKEELPETGNTLEENALQKARTIFQKFNVACFADDTGLEIEALGGKPGIYSARYAGEKKCFKDNMLKVLGQMKRIKNRTAVFRTVIALITEDKSPSSVSPKGRNSLPGVYPDFFGRKGCQPDRVILAGGWAKEYLFEGKINGVISEEMKGGQGFGYDPIFIPDGYKRTYAELSLEEKNLISHRAIAVKKLKEFLNT